MSDARSEREELALNAARLLVTRIRRPWRWSGQSLSEWPTSCPDIDLIANFDQLPRPDQVAAYDEGYR